MKIREYAKLVGFEVVGRLSYMGKWDFSNRWFTDEDGNIYLLDVVIGGVRIIAKRPCG